MVGYLKLYFWVFISLELFHAKWELHIVNNYQINVQKVNLSKFYPRNPLFTPQNGVERSAELKPILTMSARPQMTHTTQKINIDRPVTRIYTGICTIGGGLCDLMSKYDQIFSAQSHALKHKMDTNETVTGDRSKRSQCDST